MLGFVFWIIPLFSEISETNTQDHANVEFYTIPKSGTHLLRRIVQLITHEDNYLNIEGDIHIVPEVLESKNPKVLLIRDLRDVMISQVFWFRAKNFAWPGGGELCFVDPKFQTLSFNEQISWVINFPEEFWGLKEYAQMAIEIIKLPNTHVCRFEDLVGPQGGQDRLRQENAIKDLAAFLGFSLSYEEISYIADNAFGNSATFRRGQTGSWSEMFSKKNKELFKKRMGQELIDLGYVADEDW